MLGRRGEKWQSDAVCFCPQECDQVIGSEFLALIGPRRNLNGPSFYLAPVELVADHPLNVCSAGAKLVKGSAECSNNLGDFTAVFQ